MARCRFITYTFLDDADATSLPTLICTPSRCFENLIIEKVSISWGGLMLKANFKNLIRQVSVSLSSRVSVEYFCCCWYIIIFYRISDKFDAFIVHLTNTSLYSSFKSRSACTLSYTTVRMINAIHTKTGMGPVEYGVRSSDSNIFTFSQIIVITLMLYAHTPLHGLPWKQGICALERITVLRGINYEDDEEDEVSPPPPATHQNC